MKKGPPFLLAVLFFTAACATTRTATAPDPPVPPEPPRESPAANLAAGGTFSLFPELKSNAVNIATAPLRWEGSDWAKFGLGVAAVGGVVLLDKDFRRVVDRNSSGPLNDVARAVGPFGAEYSFGALGAFYLAGRFLKDDRARAVAEDGLVSSVLAAGVITPILKLAVGRRRPSQTESTFARGGGSSFPSGHATQAFAVASVIASHYESPWIQAAAYGLAGLVGLSRMEQGAHYASDVLAGALIGISVGKAVVRFHESERLRIAVMPSVSHRSFALGFSIQ